mgnify:CR=1 FL=1
MFIQVNPQVYSYFGFHHKIASSLVSSFSILTLLMICDVCNFSMIFCNNEGKFNLTEVKFIKLLYYYNLNYLNLVVDCCFCLCYYFTLSYFVDFYFYKVNTYLLFQFFNF